MLYLDCESAGLRGDIFSAALIDDDKVLFDGFYRHPELKTNHWLRENVEPNLTGTEYFAMQEFRAAFANVWRGLEEKACVCHMGAPVEANFFQQLFDSGLIEEFGGMYPMLDTAPLLHKSGFDPTSELAYLNAKGIEFPVGKPHSALFDAQVTKLVWSQF